MSIIEKIKAINKITEQNKAQYDLDRQKKATKKQVKTKKTKEVVLSQI